LHDAVLCYRNEYRVERIFNESMEILGEAKKIN
jgi:hypothetical protein